MMGPKHVGRAQSRRDAIFVVHVPSEMPQPRRGDIVRLGTVRAGQDSFDDGKMMPPLRGLGLMFGFDSTKMSPLTGLAFLPLLTRASKTRQATTSNRERLRRDGERSSGAMACGWAISIPAFC